MVRRLNGKNARRRQAAQEIADNGKTRLPTSKNINSARWTSQIQCAGDDKPHHKMNPSRSLSQFVCSACRRTDLPQAIRKPFAVRLFQTSTRTFAPRDDETIDLAFRGVINQQNARTRQTTRGGSSGFISALDSDTPPQNQITTYPSIYHQRHRLHVYATKHNTHITLTAPVPHKDTNDNNPYRAPEPNKVILSLAAGNIGFRKAGRGSYDAAFQLTAFVTKQIKERGLLREIRDMEVVLRGFGAGREAVTKALLGVEGKNIRGKIKSVVDSTRLKFGGPRSPKPRRLG